jgi:hypothetical protein
VAEVKIWRRNGKTNKTIPATFFAVQKLKTPSPTLSPAKVVDDDTNNEGAKTPFSNLENFKRKTALSHVQFNS